MRFSRRIQVKSFGNKAIQFKINLNMYEQTNLKLFLWLSIISGVTMISVAGYTAWKVNKDMGKAQQKISQPVINKQKAQKETITLENKEVTKEVQPTQPEIDISDWKVYRNEEYGFEIKFPRDFYYFPNKYSDNLEVSFQSQKYSGGFEWPRYELEIFDNNNGLSIND